MLQFKKNIQNTCNNVEEVKVAPGSCCCCSCCCCVSIGINNGTAASNLNPAK